MAGPPVTAVLPRPTEIESAKIPLVWPRTRKLASPATAALWLLSPISNCGELPDKVILFVLAKLTIPPAPFNVAAVSAPTMNLAVVAENESNPDISNVALHIPPLDD